LKRLRGLVLPIIIGLLVQAAFAMQALNSDALAPPTEIAKAFMRAVSDGTLASASLETVGSAAIGLVVGGLIGIAIGISLGFSLPLARMSFLPIEALRSLPAIALMPLVLLAYGFGYRTEILIVAFASIWPTLLMSQQAVRSIHREQMEVARMLQLSPFKVLGAVVFPAIAQRLFTSLRLTAGLALVVAVTVEIFGNPQGLGYAIAVSEQNLDPALSLAMLLWVGVLGYVLNSLLVMAEGRAFSWTRSVSK
jgi:ABC-type nitrate/sulfonate/bicarbonate transport system permease component